MIDINSFQIVNCLLYSVSIITFLLVLLLLYVEFNYYMYPGYKFRFTPDSEFTAKLKLNVDLTVAMPCDCKSIHSFYYSFFIYLILFDDTVIGADILDKTGQNAYSFGRLKEEPTWWELDSNQR